MAKRKPAAPRVPPLTEVTGRAVVAWIAALPAKYREGHKSPLAAACWWAAYRTVQSTAEDTTRHVAQAMQAGALKPIRTLRDVEHVALMDGDDDYNVVEQLRADLAEFFLDIPRETSHDDEQEASEEG